MSASDSLAEHIAEGDPDYSIERVPASARMSRLSLHMAYWAVISALFSVVFSSALATTYGAINTFAGTAAAVVVLGFAGGTVARFASRTGMSVDIFSRTVFGKSGGMLATALVLGCLSFFAVIESAIIAEALHGYFQELRAWHAYLLVVLISVPIAFGRISAYLDKFNAWLLPVFIVGMIYIVIAAIDHGGYSNDWLSYGPDGGSLDGRCINVFFLWALGGAQLLAAQDYGRFGRPQDARYHYWITFGIPLFLITYSINGAVGIFITATVAGDLGALDSDAAAVRAIVTLTGFAGVIFVVVSQMRINTLNYQMSTVNLQAFLKHLGVKITKVFAALCVGVGVFLAMLGNVLGILVGALGYFAIFVGAWCAIAIVHMSLVSEQHIISAHEQTEAQRRDRFWHPSTIIWLVSSSSGVMLKLLGNPALEIYAIPMAILTGAVLHAGWLRMANKPVSAPEAS